MNKGYVCVCVCVCACVCVWMRMLREPGESEERRRLLVTFRRAVSVLWEDQNLMNGFTPGI